MSPHRACFASFGTSLNSCHSGPPLPTIQMHGVTHLVYRPRRCAPPFGASDLLSPLAVTLQSGSLLPKHRPTRGGRSCYRLSKAEQTSDGLVPGTLPPSAHLDKALSAPIINLSETLSSPYVSFSQFSPTKLRCTEGRPKGMGRQASPRPTRASWQRVSRSPSTSGANSSTRLGERRAT